MSKNLQRLGEKLSERMRKTAGAAVPVTVELGTIKSNMALDVDSLDTPIPKGQYMVNIMLASSSYRTTSERCSDQEDETHSHGLPSVFRALRSGDRVLVVWCGFEPIVVSVITKS